MVDLETGKFDPDANGLEQEEQATAKETTTNGEAVQTGGDAPDSNAAPTSTDEQKGGDDEMQFNAEGEDEGGDANGKQDDSKRPVNRGEELAVPPEGNQVMIRTIPPDIGRIKLEEVRPLFLLFACL